MTSSLLKTNPKTLSVGIIGFTGETGKALTKEILSKNLFKRTVLIGRRTVDFEQDFYKRAEQYAVDFDKLEEHQNAFENLDVVYCCLGTTRGKSGVEGFKKVDFDYVNNTADLAVKKGCKQFHLVSSSGANKDSLLLYSKVKGQAEEAVSNKNIQQVFIYRPKMLVGAVRSESRPFESLTITLTKPFQCLTPTLLSTPIETLAKALIANTILNTEQENTKNRIIFNDKIFNQARLYDEFIKNKY